MNGNTSHATSSEGVFEFDDLDATSYAYDPVYSFLIQHQLSPLVIAEFCEMVRQGILTVEDFDDRLIEFAKSQPEPHARFVLNQFRKSNLMGVVNAAHYLGSLLRNFKDRVRQVGAEAALDAPVFYAPSREKLQALVQRTGYPLEVTIGQRKYGGPPPNYEGSQPGNGCEIYIGKIPKEVYEDELVPVLEKFGTIYDLRLMMDPLNGTNKGYAFATYTTKQDASSAAKILEGYEVRPGKKLRCNVSIANTRLFIGNIPKAKSKEDILSELTTRQDLEGVKDVIIYPDAEDPVNRKNCGYCFIEFIDHKSASTAKRRLADGHIKPWNSNVVVNWAEPQEEADDETMSTVRTIFIKNLRSNIDEEMVRQGFSVFGEIWKVRRIKDYAFVFFSERDSAVQAIEKMHNKEFHDAMLDVSLARPQSDARKKAQQSRYAQRNATYGGNMMMGSSYYGNYAGASAGLNSYYGDYSGYSGTAESTYGNYGGGFGTSYDYQAAGSYEPNTGFRGGRGGVAMSRGAPGGGPMRGRGGPRPAMAAAAPYPATGMMYGMRGGMGMRGPRPYGAGPSSNGAGYGLGRGRGGYY